MKKMIALVAAAFFGMTTTCGMVFAADAENAEPAMQEQQMQKPATHSVKKHEKARHSVKSHKVSRKHNRKHTKAAPAPAEAM